MIETPKIYELRDLIVQKFHPQKVILFGSYAYGTPRPDSDVDLLIEFEDVDPYVCAKFCVGIELMTSCCDGPFFKACHLTVEILTG